VVLILTESADSLAIYYQALERFSRSILQFYGLAPDPESLSAGIDGMADSKSAVMFLVEKNAVEQE